MLTDRYARGWNLTVAENVIQLLNKAAICKWSKFFSIRAFKSSEEGRKVYSEPNLSI